MQLQGHLAKTNFTSAAPSSLHRVLWLQTAALPLAAVCMLSQLCFTM